MGHLIGLSLSRLEGVIDQWADDKWTGVKLSQQSLFVTGVMLLLFRDVMSQL